MSRRHGVSRLYGPLDRPRSPIGRDNYAHRFTVAQVDQVLPSAELLVSTTSVAAGGRSAVQETVPQVAAWPTSRTGDTNGSLAATEPDALETRSVGEGRWIDYSFILIPESDPGDGAGGTLLTFDVIVISTGTGVDNESAVNSLTRYRR
jgi:hypothetical protein